MESRTMREVCPETRRELSAKDSLRWARHLLRLANRALARIDPVFLSRSRRDSPPPLFVVGVPRSGTTLLYQLVTQQLQVGYFIEIANYLYGMPNGLMRLLRLVSGRPRPQFESKYGRTRGFLSPAESGNFWFRWFPRDGDQGHYVDPDAVDMGEFATLRENIRSMTLISGRPLVFKCVYLDMVIGVLARLLPDARFVLVKRDLLYVCQSLLIGREKRSNPWAWWSVKPPRYRELLSLPLWQQVTEQAFHTDRILRRDLARYAGERCFEIEYEHLCQHPRAFLKEFAAWVEPIGYRTYDEQVVPESFRCANEVVLADDMASRIATHLRCLEEQTEVETHR